MLGREEEEGIPVSFKYETDVTVGDFSVTSLDVYAWYSGGRVTKVPAGATFKLHADYYVANSNAGITAWSTAMSIWNVTDNIKESCDTHGAHTGGGSRWQQDAKNVVMPDKATTYRIKIHCNQKALAGEPPTDKW